MRILTLTTVSIDIRGKLDSHILTELLAVKTCCIFNLQNTLSTQTVASISRKGV